MKVRKRSLAVMMSSLLVNEFKQVHFSWEIHFGEPCERSRWLRTHASSWPQLVVPAMRPHRRGAGPRKPRLAFHRLHRFGRSPTQLSYRGFEPQRSLLWSWRPTMPEQTESPPSVGRVDST